jgi:3(or 17)beta-hydroxysteroid dehydrogenase
MARVEGKVVLITGAASGLGRAAAILLAREGAKVEVSDDNEEAGREVATQIDGLFVHHDVCDEASWRSAIGQTLERFGRLDVLVNNAGNVLVADIEDTTLEQYRQIHTVHAEGTFLGCKHAIRAMRDRGGAIINMGSLAALRGYPPVFAYVAAKGAIRAMTTTVAAHCREKAYPIRCNAIFPGVIDTPLAVSVVGHLPGAGKPEDVAAAVLFLASDESRHMTGAEIVIDNGASIVAAG